MSDKPTHTVRKTFHAEEVNRVVKPGEPFTPNTEVRGKALALRGVIEEGYASAKEKAAAGPSKNKAVEPGKNKGGTPPAPPVPPAPPAP